MSSDHTSRASTWRPLRENLFRALWIASIVSSIGTWMQDVGAAWLMILLAPSPTMVALVQTLTSLPFFFLALPAGALADIVDRRRLLLFSQSWMLVAAVALGSDTSWRNHTLGLVSTYVHSRYRRGDEYAGLAGNHTRIGSTR